MPLKGWVRGAKRSGSHEMFSVIAEVEAWGCELMRIHRSFS